MKMLFKPEDGTSKTPDFDAAEALQEAYETVNEGDTTDTTSGIDTEGLLAARQQETSQTQST